MRISTRRYIAFIIIFPLLILSLIWLLWNSEPIEDPTLTYIYLVPEKIEGCVWIYYDEPGAEPLKLINNKVVFDIPDSGIMKTSSDLDFIPAYPVIPEIYSVTSTGTRTKVDITTLEHESGVFIEDELGIVREWVKIDKSSISCDRQDPLNNSL